MPFFPQVTGDAHGIRQVHMSIPVGVQQSRSQVYGV